MQPLNNYVLIELPGLNSTVKVGDKEFIIDLRFHLEDHVNRWGTVIGVPDLYYKKSDIHSMPWDCEMELLPKDVVYFDYLLAIEALGCLINDLITKKEENPRYRIVNGKIQIYMPYNQCYLRIRGNKITPINGFTLISPLETDIVGIKKKKINEGIVRYVGEPNKEYRHGYTDSIVEVGDQVFLKRYANLYLEYKQHGTMEPLYVVQAHRIRGKTIIN